jgi:phage tail sheath protein FI
MPEYLTPGVYLEETSYRSKSIEGVSTSTFGMAGVTRYGPVPYVRTEGGQRIALVPKPVLVTSFTEYERAFGGLGPDGTLNGDTLYLAYAARAFFDNGGRRLYVSRVFPFTNDPGAAMDGDPDFASLDSDAAGKWRARWPGSAGSSISVKVEIKRGKNIRSTDGSGKIVLRGVNGGEAVETFSDPKDIPTDKAPKDPVPGNVRQVAPMADGRLGLRPAAGGAPVEPDASALAVCHLTATVTVTMGQRTDVYAGLEFGSDHRRSIPSALGVDKPVDEYALVWFDPKLTPAPTIGAFVDAIKRDAPGLLIGGSDGKALDPDALRGEASDPDDAAIAATGLEALGEIDDIAIVAVPDIAAFDDIDLQKVAVDNLIGHCEKTGAYRIAIVDPPNATTSLSQIRDFRSQFDTTYAALYYPWLEIPDPTAPNDPTAPPAVVNLPPSGFTAGIYARSDIERGVHKAPANEVILGINKFLYNVTYDRQSVINPEGINALRFFPGRSNRVWGARTMSSDPEWKYVNVRRLFIYLEHSIDKSTQWAVFEPNNERLWANIRQTIEDFLVTVWRTGALMGTKPAEAFFVRCDRTTMTQNDLDNGRLICLIGVAPTYPAEFVIFRIGQWTADAKTN